MVGGKPFRIYVHLGPPKVHIDRQPGNAAANATTLGSRNYEYRITAAAARRQGATSRSLARGRE